MLDLFCHNLAHVAFKVAQQRVDFGHKILLLLLDSEHDLLVVVFDLRDHFLFLNLNVRFNFIVQALLKLQVLLLDALAFAAENFNFSQRLPYFLIKLTFQFVLVLLVGAKKRAVGANVAATLQAY